MTAGGAMVGDGGIEQTGERIHGHEQHCGDCGGGSSTRGLSGHGKIEKN